MSRFWLDTNILDKISQRFQISFGEQIEFRNKKVEMFEQGVEVCLRVQVVHLLNFVKVMNVHMDKHSIHPAQDLHANLLEILGEFNFST